MFSSDRIKTLFEQLLEVPVEDWTRWLDRHAPDAGMRAELEALIEADNDQHGPLDISAASYAELLDDVQQDTTGETDPTLIPQSLLGSRFGAFRLVRLLGRGGMATVFLGEREGADFAQQAAVKILHRGLYSEAEQHLFRRERRILARLEHPDIARLIDGGVSAEGVPFLVLEYIDGMPITDYARVRGLDARARLQLMLRLARAVEAAHHALVVHRDLKPGNVLVSQRGDLKVLDFGIAKLVEDDEEGVTEVARLTPAYAAPEQLGGGAITAATDVYALGILLRELLTGRHPKRDADADAKATALALLPAEVQRIIAMACAPEANRRYASAAAFADDIERYLQGRPVLAHPPSTWYHARKFVARHRGAVVVTAALMLGIVASLGIALWQARAAQIEAQRSDEVGRFLLSLFESAVPVRDRAQMPTTLDILETGLSRLDNSFRRDPVLKGIMQGHLGGILNELGRHEQAQPLLDASVATLSATLGPRDRRTLEVTLSRAGLSALQKQYDDANARIEAALAHTGAFPDLDLRLRGLAATVRYDQHDNQRSKAIDEYQALLTRSERELGAEHDVTCDLRRKLAFALEGSLRHKEAQAVLDAVLRDEIRRHGEGHVQVVAVMSRIMRNTIVQGQFDRAIEMGRRIATLDDKIYSGPSRPRISHMTDLAHALSQSGQHDEAVALSLRAVEDFRALAGPDDPDVGSFLNNYGATLVEAGQGAKAEPVLRESMEQRLAAGGPGDQRAAQTRTLLGRALALQGRHDEAEREYAQSLATKLALSKAPQLTLVKTLIAWAESDRARGRHDKARERATEALAMLDALSIGPHRDRDRIAAILASGDAARPDADSNEKDASRGK